MNNVFIILAIIALWSSAFFIGISSQASSDEKQAVAHGCGYFDKETTQFKWNEK